MGTLFRLHPSTSRIALLVGALFLGGTGCDCNSGEPGTGLDAGSGVDGRGGTDVLGSDSASADGTAGLDATTGDESCKEVDIVIAVDNSGSMSEEIEAMREDVFPAFATALRDIGDGLEDFRVAVIDACPEPATFHTESTDGDCGFFGGNAWMTSESPNLEDEFRCIADLYEDDVECSGRNDDEQPASAAATSLGAPFITNQNADFLREDALLVVVAITDEDETPVPDASMMQLYNRLVDIKGDVRRIVFLGIGGSRDCDGVYGGADDASELQGLSQLFIDEERGVFWDLCEGRLEDGLTEAITTINSACEDLPDLI